ncbi:MAG: GntR family transcriptional regulator [Firmicutes bacterium]|nr:GntR family transcriptional regulator [Bacillota bacterium]
MKKENTEIYKEIENRIVKLKYEPGELIKEKELINEFNVSRTPIREALLKLSEKGLVKMIPRVGTYVSQIDIKNIKYAYETKKYLEMLASELASLRATNEEIEKIVKISERIDTYDTIKNYKDYIEDDHLFRKTIREASKNPMLIEYLEELNVITGRFIRYIHYKIKDPKWYNRSLKKIAYAIKNRDSELARKETEKHLAIFLEEVSKKFFM